MRQLVPWEGSPTSSQNTLQVIRMRVSISGLSASTRLAAFTASPSVTAYSILRPKPMCPGISRPVCSPILTYISTPPVTPYSSLKRSIASIMRITVRTAPMASSALGTGAPKTANHSIADELVDDSALVENDVDHALQVVVGGADYALRSHLLVDRGETADVGKKHCRGAPRAPTPTINLKILNASRAMSAGT